MTSSSNPDETKVVVKVKFRFKKVNTNKNILY